MDKEQILSAYKLEKLSNPFNSRMKIRYRHANIGFVSLKVYDILGREVSTLENEEKPVGEYEVEFKSSVGSLPDGKAGWQLPTEYIFYRLEADNFIKTKKCF